jgi:hypothetical protein
MVKGKGGGEGSGQYVELAKLNANRRDGGDGANYLQSSEGIFAGAAKQAQSCDAFCNALNGDGDNDESDDDIDDGGSNGGGDESGKAAAAVVKGGAAAKKQKKQKKPAGRGPWRCNVKILALVNTCENLDHYFAGACRDCKNSAGPEQPTMVVADAAERLRPGMCLVHEKVEDTTCDGTHAFTRRLCVCIGADFKKR